LAEESRALPMPDWTAIGARVPDRDAARAAEELCREVSAWILYAHCLHSYLFAVLLGREDGMSHDEEALYVACLLHDVGLTPATTIPSGRSST
jgi:HD domain